MCHGNESRLDIPCHAWPRRRERSVVADDFLNRNEPVVD